MQLKQMLIGAVAVSLSFGLAACGNQQAKPQAAQSSSKAKAKKADEPKITLPAGGYASSTGKQSSTSSTKSAKATTGTLTNQELALAAYVELYSGVYPGVPEFYAGGSGNQFSFSMGTGPSTMGVEINGDTVVVHSHRAAGAEQYTNTYSRTQLEQTYGSQKAQLDATLQRAKSF
ncbi:MAG: hypothetical protein MJ139_03945 [Limosilactobacillus sp.]|nr:hypothetical protein [Limosilactobacillus sp.]